MPVRASPFFRREYKSVIVSRVCFRLANASRLPPAASLLWRESCCDSTCIRVTSALACASWFALIDNQMKSTTATIKLTTSKATSKPLSPLARSAPLPAPVLIYRHLAVAFHTPTARKRGRHETAYAAACENSPARTSAAMLNRSQRASPSV